MKRKDSKEKQTMNRKIIIRNETEDDIDSITNPSLPFPTQK